MIFQIETDLEKVTARFKEWLKALHTADDHDLVEFRPLRSGDFRSKINFWIGDDDNSVVDGMMLTRAVGVGTMTDITSESPRSRS